MTQLRHRPTCQLQPRAIMGTYAGEMKTGILLSLPRIVHLASASATFLRIRGRKWIFWYASAFWFFATSSAYNPCEEGVLTDLIVTCRGIVCPSDFTQHRLSEFLLSASTQFGRGRTDLEILHINNNTQSSLFHLLPLPFHSLFLLFLFRRHLQPNSILLLVSR